MPGCTLVDMTRVITLLEAFNPPLADTLCHPIDNPLSLLHRNRPKIRQPVNLGAKRRTIVTLIARACVQVPFKPRHSHIAPAKAPAIPQYYTYCIHAETRASFSHFFPFFLSTCPLPPTATFFSTPITSTRSTNSSQRSGHSGTFWWQPTPPYGLHAQAPPTTTPGQNNGPTKTGVVCLTKLHFTVY